MKNMILFKRDVYLHYKYLYRYMYALIDDNYLIEDTLWCILQKRSKDDRRLILFVIYVWYIRVFPLPFNITVMR